MNSILSYLAGARKALAAVVGVAVTLLTVYNHVPFLPDQPLVVTVLGILTALGVWLTPNKTA